MPLPPGSAGPWYLQCCRGRPMPFSPSIQALIGPNTPQNNENVQCWVDWGGNVWIIGPHPTLSGTYIAQQGLFSGAELDFVNTNSWTQPPFHEYPISADTTRGDVWVSGFQPSNLLIAGKKST